MNRFTLCSLCLLGWFPLHATTTEVPASALLLDNKAAIELTSGLSQYENLPKLSGKLTSVGSGLVTITINRWASEFATLYPDVALDIRGGGSDGSFQDFLAGKLDLMPMSRPLRPDEITRFKDKFGYAPSQMVVALDAVGIYVNKNNPLTGLTLVQLDAIYSREAKRGGHRMEFWRELGVTGPLAGERIMRLTLSHFHGTHYLFRDVVMLGADYRFDGRFEMVSSALVQSVGADDDAIGFASVMFATARTRLVPLQVADGEYLLPSYENTVSGRYPLVRPLVIVFNRKPDGAMNPVVQEFLRFAVSRRGQRIIALAEGYPITLEQQQAALRAIK